MKTHPYIAAALFLTLASGAVITTAGCAATPTRRSTGETLDDTMITTKVKAALFKDPVVSGFDVGVTTYRGEVQLNGFVDTAEQVAQAERVARSVNGVTKISNKLTVKKRAPR
jgi:hyperosmotically inducible protein